MRVNNRPHDFNFRDFDIDPGVINAVTFSYGIRNNLQLNWRYKFNASFITDENNSVHVKQY